MKKKERVRETTKEGGRQKQKHQGREKRVQAKMRDKLYKAAYKFIGILNLHEKIIQAPCCSDSPVGCCTYPPYKQCESPSLYLQSGSVSQVGKLVFFMFYSIYLDGVAVLQLRVANIALYISETDQRVFRTTFANLSTFSRAVKKQMLELLKEVYFNVNCKQRALDEANWHAWQSKMEQISRQNLYGKGAFFINSSSLKRVILVRGTLVIPKAIHHVIKRHTFSWHCNFYMNIFLIVKLFIVLHIL